MCGRSIKTLSRNVCIAISPPGRTARRSDGHRRRSRKLKHVTQSKASALGRQVSRSAWMRQIRERSFACSAEALARASAASLASTPVAFQPRRASQSSVPPAPQAKSSDAGTLPFSDASAAAWSKCRPLATSQSFGSGSMGASPLLYRSFHRSVSSVAMRVNVAKFPVAGKRGVRFILVALFAEARWPAGRASHVDEGRGPGA